MADGDSFVGSVVSGLGQVMNFLGAGAGDAVEAAGGAIKARAAEAQGVRFYGDALAMCGTEGQIALIQELGPGAFEECISYALENEGETGGFLVDQSSHPEAVGELLSEIEEEISLFVEPYLNDDGLQVSDLD